MNSVNIIFNAQDQETHRHGTHLYLSLEPYSPKPGNIPMLI